jgi:outer membrane protein assembly factor BamB
MRLLILFLAVALEAADWPHWRGPNRDSHSRESSGWDNGVRLPETAVWEAEFGAGASAPLVIDGTLYTLGWAGGHDTLYAVDAATGAIRWTQLYSCHEYGRHATGDKGMYRGVSATPEYDPATGYLFSLSTDGDLNCWDTRAQGKRVWSLNLYERYRIPSRPQVTGRQGSLRDYGYTSAPLVHGGSVLVEAGASAGNIIAFDTRSGKQLWTSENKDPAGHSGGLAPMTVDGVACVAVLTARHLVVSRIDGGQEVARFPWVTDFINNIATPAVVGNRVLISSKYNVQATALLEISLERGARELWRIGDATGVCSPLVHKDKIYWVNRGLYCFDLATGRRQWSGGRFTDPGSCVMTADERLLIWANNGDLMIADSATQSPDKAHILQMRRGIFRGKAWSHIVLANSRICVRDIAGGMKCFSLRTSGS